MVFVDGYPNPHDDMLHPGVNFFLRGELIPPAPVVPDQNPACFSRSRSYVQTTGFLDVLHNFQHKVFDGGRFLRLE